jgi:hypothetical protein
MKSKQNWCAQTMALGATLSLVLLGNACSAAGAADLSTQVDPTLLASQDQIKQWVADKASFAHAFMPTGSAAHRSYVDQLAGWMQSSCVTGFTRDSFPYYDWQAQNTSLNVSYSNGKSKSVKVAKYIAYSGETDANGIQAPLFVLPHPWVTKEGTVKIGNKTIDEAMADYAVSGKIVVVDVPKPYIPNALIRGDMFNINDPDHTIPIATASAWLTGQGAVPQIEAALAKAQAAGLVAVLPFTDPTVTNMYAPINGIHVGLPGVYVDSATGFALATAVRTGTAATAKLVLQANVNPSGTMDNLVATIPSNSSRTIIVSSHTDGANAVEDNGPPAIQALIDYFCKVPQDQRPVTISIVMDGGHFAGNAGLKHYVAANTDSISHALAEIEVEHIGALDTKQQWGKFKPTGKPAVTTITLSTLSKPPHDEALTFSNDVTPSILAPRSILNFGASGPFYTMVPGLNVIQIIVGPNYLLSADWGDDTILNQLIDYGAMHDQIQEIAQMILNLGNTSDADYLVQVPNPVKGAAAGQTKTAHMKVDLEAAEEGR